MCSHFPVNRQTVAVTAINKRVGTNTNIVVGKNPGSKLKKSEKYNTPQLNEAELLALLDNKGQ